MPPSSLPTVDRMPVASGPRAPARWCLTQLGFTLMELMLVLAIAAIIAVIAIPNYRAYVDRAKVSVAVGDIGRMKLRIDAWQLANNDALPASLADVGFGGQLDPWGFPYVYFPYNGDKNNKGARKDKNLHPLNTYYDLYSIGPDGATNLPITAKVSQDDIIMANDGTFVGKASDY